MDRPIDNREAGKKKRLWKRLGENKPRQCGHDGCVEQSLRTRLVKVIRLKNKPEWQENKRNIKNEIGQSHPRSMSGQISTCSNRLKFSENNTVTTC